MQCICDSVCCCSHVCVCIHACVCICREVRRCLFLQCIWILFIRRVRLTVNSRSIRSLAIIPPTHLHHTVTHMHEPQHTHEPHQCTLSNQIQVEVWFVWRYMPICMRACAATNRPTDRPIVVQQQQAEPNARARPTTHRLRIPSSRLFSRMKCVSPCGRIKYQVRASFCFELRFTVSLIA